MNRDLEMECTAIKADGAKSARRVAYETSVRLLAKRFPETIVYQQQLDVLEELEAMKKWRDKWKTEALAWSDLAVRLRDQRDRLLKKAGSKAVT